MFSLQLVDALTDAHIAYCVVGGGAVNLHGASSLDSDDVVARSVQVGAGVCVAAVADLIALKRRANRTQDLADIAQLERLGVI